MKANEASIFPPQSQPRPQALLTKLRCELQLFASYVQKLLKQAVCCPVLSIKSGFCPPSCNAVKAIF